MAYRNDSAAEC